MTLYRRGQPTNVKLPKGAQVATSTFSQGSTKLCLADGTNVYLVDLSSGTLRTLAHPDPVVFMEFSPDGAALICASSDVSLEERSARLWDTAKGRPIGSPLRHGDGVVTPSSQPTAPML